MVFEGAGNLLESNLKSLRFSESPGCAAELCLRIGVAAGIGPLSIFPNEFSLQFLPGRHLPDKITRRLQSSELLPRSRRRGESWTKATVPNSSTGRLEHMRT